MKYINFKRCLLSNKHSIQLVSKSENYYYLCWEGKNNDRQSIEGSGVIELSTRQQGYLRCNLTAESYNLIKNTILLLFYNELKYDFIHLGLRPSLNSSDTNLR